MTDRWPRLTMAEIAPLVRRPIQVDAEMTYREIGIRSFGKGVFHKSPTTDLEIGEKRVFVIKPGDLLFNIVFAWEGAVAVATAAEEGTIGSHRFLTCVPNAEIADPYFLFWWFSRGEGREQLLRASPGGAGRNRTLGIDKLAAIQVPVPPLAVQRSIVASIGKLKAKLDEACKLREEAVAESQLVLASVIGGIEFRLSQSEGNLGRGIRYFKNGLSRRPSGEEQGPVVLRLADVSSGHISLNAPRRGILTTEEINAYSVTTTDLLVVRVNGSRSIVGRFITVPETTETLCFNDHLIKVCLDPAVFDARYVAAMSRGKTARSHMERLAITTAGQFTINQTMLAALPIPIIPLAEQLGVVAEFETLQAHVSALRKLQIETAAELDALLPAILDNVFGGQAEARIAA
jgi:type I restriction enzyme S subunit